MHHARDWWPSRHYDWRPHHQQPLTCWCHWPYCQDSCGDAMLLLGLDFLHKRLTHHGGSACLLRCASPNRVSGLWPVDLWTRHLLGDVWPGQTWTYSDSLYNKLPQLGHNVQMSVFHCWLLSTWGQINQLRKSKKKKEGLQWKFFFYCISCHTGGHFPWCNSLMYTAL